VYAEEPARAAFESSREQFDRVVSWLEGAESGRLTHAELEAQLQTEGLFLTDARIPIHNNASERRLRVIALGRKNFLFFGDKFSGRNFAGLYSLVGSCIANGVEPTEYLTDVLLRVRHAATPEALDALLPDRWRAPEA
jgi:transposase